MATKFGIVYATGSKMIRRIIVPDADWQLQGQAFVGPGETILISPAGPIDVASCAALVKAATGVAPPDPTCAVVDKTNTVVAIISADPAIDVLPGVMLVSAYSPKIVSGCTYDSVGGLFTAPPVTVPAYVGPDSSQHPQQNIPATVIQKSVAVQGAAA